MKNILFTILTILVFVQVGSSQSQTQAVLIDIYSCGSIMDSCDLCSPKYQPPTREQAFFDGLAVKVGTQAMRLFYKPFTVTRSGANLDRFEITDWKGTVTRFSWAQVNHSTYPTPLDLYNDLSDAACMSGGGGGGGGSSKNLVVPLWFISFVLAKILPIVPSGPFGSLSQEINFFTKSIEAGLQRVSIKSK